jgi:hypothetical protein
MNVSDDITAKLRFSRCRAVLEAKLFADAGTKQGYRRQIEPDWASIHRELKRKHLTLSILWDEYVEACPPRFGTAPTHATSARSAPWCLWKNAKLPTLRSPTTAAVGLYPARAWREISPDTVSSKTDF